MSGPALPSFPKMFWRGARRRCPLCGGRGAWFRGWMHKLERCRTCNFRWNRDTDGFMTGSMTINIIITFITMTAAMAVMVIATVPDIPVLPVTLVLLAIGICVPLLVHPSSCTMWSAADCAMRPLTEAELADMDAARIKA